MQLFILITITLLAISTSVAALPGPARSIQVLSARRLSLVDEHALNLDSTGVTRSHPRINGYNARRRRPVPSSGDQFYPRSSASLGESIRSARVRLGLSQAELAQRIGVTRAAMSGYEQGTIHLSASVMMVMEKVLGVKLHG